MCADALCPYMGGEVLEEDLPGEPVGYDEIATGSVSSRSPFWRTLSEFCGDAVDQGWLPFVVGCRGWAPP